MERPFPAPATPPRLPTLDDLTPEERQKLLAQGWTAAEDGSLTPPANAGGMPKAYDLGGGGYGAALSGPPATRPPAGAPPSPLGSGPSEAAPDALNARIELASPAEKLPLTNPMKDALPEPFEAPKTTPPLMAQPAPDLKAAASKSSEGNSGGYGGRIGRRQQSRTAPGRSRGRRR
jgi:hypothetical protein